MGDWLLFYSNTFWIVLSIVIAPRTHDCYLNCAKVGTYTIYLFSDQPMDNERKPEIVRDWPAVPEWEGLEHLNTCTYPSMTMLAIPENHPSSYWSGENTALPVSPRLLQLLDLLIYRIPVSLAPYLTLHLGVKLSEPICAYGEVEFLMPREYCAWAGAAVHRLRLLGGSSHGQGGIQTVTNGFA